jgi:serine/threonine protein kinase
VNPGEDILPDPDTTPTLGSEDPDQPGGESGDTSSSGKRIGPYKILGEIGRGGMGIVYKAFHPVLKRTVALKVLIAGEDASEEAIARFHREAEAVAKLGHHPNIVPIYEIGREGHNHYFAMHFVEGKPLDKVIDDAGITPKQAAVITKQLAEALHHAHRHGVLHRDVKPANVLMAFTKLEGEPSGEPKSEIPNLNGKKIAGSAHVGGWDLEVGGSAREGGEPMLTDFGLAKDVEAESKMTRSGATIGTPQYMSPEQAKGSLEEIDERSDIFSLGAALYEMLTLHPPFDGNGIIDVIKNVLLRDPVPPRRRNPDVGRDLETICLKCLEKEPERRYPSGRELSLDLGRALEGRPILARPASVMEKLWKKIRRHRGISATILGAFLILLAGLVVSRLWIARETRGREEAETGKERAEDLLDRNMKVANVLLGAFGKLGRMHSELKASHFNTTNSMEARRDCYKGHEEAIRTYREGIPEDPDSRATLWAVEGWLMRLGGQEEEAFRKFREARETSPDVAWGYLFEAMVWLSKVLVEEPLPIARGVLGSITFEPMPPMAPKLEKARERFED